MKTLYSKLISSNYLLSIALIITTSVSQLTAQPGVGISFSFSTVAVVAAAPAFTNQVVPAANQDDFAYRFNPAGMNIIFQGQQYTSFVVSTNGWVALLPDGTPAGIPATLSAGAYLSTNQLSNNTSGFPILAPYWDDLSSTILQYNWTAPVLTVQWICRIDKTAATAAANFMMKIDGTTGVINFSYANNPAYVVAGPPSGSIGIAGVCVGDYYSYDNHSSYADSTLETTTIATKPVDVQYVFTPYQNHTLSFTGLDTLYCVTDPLAILTPINTPGTFSGSGINGNTFDPSIAGIGIHTITYNYTTSGGCLNTTSQNTRVDACLKVSYNRSISLGVYPNPNSGDFYVLAFSKSEKIVTMDIKDISGRILRSELISLKTGENKIPFHSTLAKGIYLLSITDEFDSASLKMIIN